MKDNLIAVITPCYNGEMYIEKCIQYVKNQSFTNTKHYIYNDNSNDNTANILHQYRNDLNVVVITGTDKRGQSYGRNSLIETAISDGCTHVAFLDADDKWYDNHLESSLQAITDHDIVYSKPDYRHEDGYTVYPVGFVIPQRFIGKQLLYGNFIWISTVLAKIEIFKDTKFDSSLDNIEDYYMWVEQYLKGRKFICKNSKTAEYLINSKGHANKIQGKVEIIANRIKKLSSVKLNLACGSEYLDDYINIDLPGKGLKTDAEFDIQKLPYDDNSVNEIRAFNIIEHFNFFECQTILAEWYRVLIPGGKIWIETPDLLSLCNSFVNNIDKRYILLEYFFSSPWIENRVHKFLFTEDQLKSHLLWAGFNNFKRLVPNGQYINLDNQHLYLNIEAFKP